MWRVLVGLFALPLLLVESAVLSSSAAWTGWAIVNVLVYPLITLACVAVHEGGHAIVARVLGLHVPRVDVGIGRRVARWRWRRTLFSLHAFPLLGMTYLGVDRVAGLRWRLWLTILAGPIANALVIAVSLALLHVGITEILWPRNALVQGPAILELVGFCATWSLAVNLVPLGGTRVGFRTDGTQLLRIPFVDAKELDELTVVPAILEAEELRERDQFEAAHEVLRRALESAPESRALRNSLAIILMHRDQVHEARALLKELLKDDSSLETVVMRNNLAWADFLIHTDEVQAEADESSALVVSRFKEVGFALGTRGAILGWLGRHDEAIAMLQQAYVRNTTDTDRALNACSLAYSFAVTGRIDEARRWLERARQNHSSCPLLPRAEAAIAQAPTTA